MKTLVIASGNAGKIREFQGLLQALPVTVRPQPEGLEVEETGSTFAANARLKAQAVAATTGEWALADDSGLSVDALDGAPGVHSARYAPTDPERIARLLKALNGSEQRQAHFCAALCIAAPDGSVLLEVEGRCDGLITASPRGSKALATTRSSKSLERGAPLPRCPWLRKNSMAIAAGPSASWNPNCVICSKQREADASISSLFSHGLYGEACR